MDRTSATGRILLAVALAAIGCQNLIGLDLVRELQPVSDSIPGRPLLGVLLGVLLIAASAGVLVGVRRAATGLAVLLSIWVLLLWVPTLLANPRNGGAWTGAFEIAALTCAAWALAGAGRIAQVGFGLCVPAFGVLHFLYVDYVASVIPGWIPGHVFLAYATGVAHIAAGLAIATGVRARLAAGLLGLMFGLWVVILHVPRVVANAGSRPEWTSLLVALAMCGASLVVASRVSRPPRA
jgi:uncharacterized membrane protein